MSNIKLKKGLDINLRGKAEKEIEQTGIAKDYAVKPTDFKGLTPKLSVKAGDTVKSGSVLFFDKYKPAVRFCSPVSGKVKEIRRGERRKLLEIIVEPDTEQQYEDFGVLDLSASSGQIIEQLLKSGLWPAIRQRPYDIVADPEIKPKAIFISAFDTAPLAPDYEFMLKDDLQLFNTGLKYLKKLTDGDIYLSVKDDVAKSIFKDVEGVKLNAFRGPHPAGNVGVQIHHLNPVNKGEVVWVVNPQDVVIIARLFTKGIYDATKTIVLAGSEVKNPKYLKIISGANIGSITENRLSNGNNRIISGNVLTGHKVDENGHLGFYHNQITVIPEGDYYEPFGWVTPGFGKFSFSRTFFSWLTPKKEYVLDTNLHGGKRAFVFNDVYGKVLPMDIYPVFLLKAILAEDIEQMENLGIYEVAEEDFALCEFVDPSKNDIQDIIRKGIDLMIKEMN